MLSVGVSFRFHAANTFYYRLSFVSFPMQQTLLILCSLSFVLFSMQQTLIFNITVCLSFHSFPHAANSYK